MRNLTAVFAGAALLVSLAAPLLAADMTIKGQVVDVACSMEKKGADDDPACALSCAKSGQPVGILTADAIYTITGDYAANKNAKLLDFVSKKVVVTGEVSEKDGQKVINVKSIKLSN